MKLHNENSLTVTHYRIVEDSFKPIFIEYYAATALSVHKLKKMRDK